MVRGFSPSQHALGQAPDIDGRFFRENVKDFPVDIMQTPFPEIEKHQKLRLAAEETFLKWQARERLARALNSKSKPFPTYSPGELVFYWRHLGRKEAGQRFHTGHFYGYAGPARLETRFDEDNRMRPSLVWLVRNNRLLKASIEQLRKASSRERTMAVIDQEIQLPWTISDIVSPLGKNEYDDITMDWKLNACLVERIENRDEQPRSAELPQKRHRTKAPVNVPVQEGANSSSSTARPEGPQPMAVEEDEEDPELFNERTLSFLFGAEKIQLKYPYLSLRQGMGGCACPKTHKCT